jgi:hypothetical protein
MMPTGFDTNDPTVLASLDNILALTEAGDDLAGRGLPTCGLADLESVACRGTTRIALANSLAQHCSEQRRTSNDPGSSGNVCFGPLCGLKSDITRGPRSAISGREHRNKKASLFDHLGEAGVGTSQQRLLTTRQHA